MIIALLLYLWIWTWKAIWICFLSLILGTAYTATIQTVPLLKQGKIQASATRAFQAEMLFTQILMMMGMSICLY